MWIIDEKHIIKRIELIFIDMFTEMNIVIIKLIKFILNNLLFINFIKFINKNKGIIFWNNDKNNKFNQFKLFMIFGYHMYKGVIPNLVNNVKFNKNIIEIINNFLFKKINIEKNKNK